MKVIINAQEFKTITLATKFLSQLAREGKLGDIRTQSDVSAALRNRISKIGDLNISYVGWQNANKPVAPKAKTVKEWIERELANVQGDWASAVNHKALAVNRNRSLNDMERKDEVAMRAEGFINSYNEAIAKAQPLIQDTVDEICKSHNAEMAIIGAESETELGAATRDTLRNMLSYHFESAYKHASEVLELVTFKTESQLEKFAVMVAGEGVGIDYWVVKSIIRTLYTKDRFQLAEMALFSEAERLVFCRNKNKSAYGYKPTNYDQIVKFLDNARY